MNYLTKKITSSLVTTALLGLSGVSVAAPIFELRLPLGGVSLAAAPAPAPAAALGLKLKHVANGYSASYCGITMTDGVKCWGKYYASTPQTILGLSGVTALTAGSTHHCAITGSGGVQCWGFNTQGQLGDGSNNNSLTTPVDVVGLGSGVTSVAAGALQTCAVQSGAVKCWGDAIRGSLGQGNEIDRNSPVTAIASGVNYIKAGNNRMYAVMNSGTVYGWGGDSSGALGNIASAISMTPIVIDAMNTETITVISSGGFHTCAINTSNQAKCWGWNNKGQLGVNPSTTSSSQVPVTVQGLSGTIVDIQAGSSTTFGLLADGTVLAWGSYEGLTDYTPAPITGFGSAVRSMHVGFSGACFILDTDDTQCIGFNSLGENGDGTIIESRTTPVYVLEGT